MLTLLFLHCFSQNCFSYIVFFSLFFLHCFSPGPPCCPKTILLTLFSSVKTLFLSKVILSRFIFSTVFFFHENTSFSKDHFFLPRLRHCRQPASSRYKNLCEAANGVRSPPPPRHVAERRGWYEEGGSYLLAKHGRAWENVYSIYMPAFVLEGTRPRGVRLCTLCESIPPSVASPAGEDVIAGKQSARCSLRG